MDSESSGVTRHGDLAPLLRLGWKASFALGLITLVFGVILVFRPVQSLIAIAVLLGVVMLVSGVYHIARALDARENERVWRGISGALFFLSGLVLLRHLHLTIALIGLFVGFTWVIQGVMALMEGFSRGRRGAEAGWSVFFGIVSLIAGIVLISAPIVSVGVLTVFTGAWFIVLGAFEMLGSLVTRHLGRRQAAAGARVPGQRQGTAADDQAMPPREAARQETAGQPAAGDSRPASRIFHR